MNKISELKSIVTPPESKYVRNTDMDWIEVFKVFGTRIPEEFIQFNKAYGDGFFISNSHKVTASIEVFGSNGLKNSSFKYSVPEILNELRLLKIKSPKKVGLPLYWEPGGFLPWGKSTNDSFIGWITDNENPDKWCTAVLRPSSDDIGIYKVSMIDFLIKIITQELICDLLPQHFPGSKGVSFEGIKYGSPVINS